METIQILDNEEEVYVKVTMATEAVWHMVWSVRNLTSSERRFNSEGGFNTFNYVVGMGSELARHMQDNYGSIVVDGDLYATMIGSGEMQLTMVVEIYQGVRLLQKLKQVTMGLKQGDENPIAEKSFRLKISNT
ncbi:MAG: hypothetical protein HYZ16_07160 [Bacteroidetes bacterium]|nr:hypothetical protein [Bacteroidota bacterium]